MTKKEMIQAMIDGKTLVCGEAIAYYDESKENPLRYKCLNVPNEPLANLDLDWQIKPEPVLIIDRFELLSYVMGRRDKGEKFLVRLQGGFWCTPESFAFGAENISQYEWTAIDETGHPVGEPHQFMKEINK